MATGQVSTGTGKGRNDLTERVIPVHAVKEHPGTPWAFLAGQELKTPLGYAWTETYTGVNRPQMGNGGGGGGGNPADDQARARLAPPKPKRPLKNL